MPHPYGQPPVRPGLVSCPSRERPVLPWRSPGIAGSPPARFAGRQNVEPPPAGRLPVAARAPSRCSRTEDRAGVRHRPADYVFVDLGPNVGALNRAVLLGSDYLILPMASDLF